MSIESAALAASAGSSFDWLVAEMKAKGWAKLYWITHETNYRARSLYDTYTAHSGFLRYVIPNRTEP